MVAVAASHADFGGVGIPQSKQANATRVSRHVRGRAKGENLLLFSHVFFKLYVHGVGNYQFRQTPEWSGNSPMVNGGGGMFVLLKMIMRNQGIREDVKQMYISGRWWWNSGVESG